MTPSIPKALSPLRLLQLSSPPELSILELPHNHQFAALRSDRRIDIYMPEHWADNKSIVLNKSSSYKEYEYATPIRSEINSPEAYYFNICRRCPHYYDIRYVQELSHDDLPYQIHHRSKCESWRTNPLYVFEELKKGNKDRCLAGHLYYTHKDFVSEQEPLTDEEAEMAAQYGPGFYMDKLRGLCKRGHRVRTYNVPPTVFAVQLDSSTFHPIEVKISTAAIIKDDDNRWHMTPYYQAANIHGTHGVPCTGSTAGLFDALCTLPYNYANSVFNEDLIRIDALDTNHDKIRAHVASAKRSGNFSRLPLITDAFLSTPDAPATHVAVIKKNANTDAWLQLTCSGVPSTDCFGSTGIVCPLQAHTHTTEEGVVINGFITPVTPVNKCWFLVLKGQGKASLLGQIDPPDLTQLSLSA